MAVNADRIVATSAVLTLLSTTAASLLPVDQGGKGELPPLRLLFGTALTFTGLSVMADFAPSVAKGLSLCILMTALTAYGIPLLDQWAGPKKKGQK